MKTSFFVRQALAALLTLFVTSGFAQNLHLAVRAGGAGYYGDLQPKAVSLKQIYPMVSLGVNYDITENIVARGYLTYAKIGADDKNGTLAMQQRNLNFKSNIYELELSAQYNIFNFNDRWWTPYVAAGVAVFNFNPYTYNANGEKIMLKPLSTEGQGFRAGVGEYSTTQLSIPITIGVQYAINEDMRIGAEFGYRKTFTDYIDDVSTTYADKNALLTARGQTAVDLAYRGFEVTAKPYPAAGSLRGNPANKDGYYFGSITFTYRAVFDVYKKIAGLPTAPKGKRMGCPGQRGY